MTTMASAAATRGWLARAGWCRTQAPSATATSGSVTV